MDQIRIVLHLFKQNWKVESGRGPGHPRKYMGSLVSCGPRFRQLWAYVTSSFAGHSFRVISGETWYYLAIHRCSFW